ncbi:MAG: type VI secretion system baseplate subunit TssG [Verrucomicrobiota bacterium]
MDSRAGQEEPSLIDRLEEEPFRYDLFYALRALECRHPDKPRIGASTNLDEDFVRFSQEPDLSFEPSIISAFEEEGEDQDRPARMTVRFPGLLGPNGPLPHHITEFVRNRMVRHRDHTLRDFLDLFNHRMIALFYRGWSSVRRHVSCDREKDDRFRFFISSLIGLSPEHEELMQGIPVNAQLHYSGILGNRTRPARGLQVILSGFFGVPVQIREFVGTWINLPEMFQCRLGEAGESACLGTAVAGTRTWCIDQKFEIVIGPIGIEQYKKILPASASFERMVSWVRSYVADTLAWDVIFRLEDTPIPMTRLGAEDPEQESAYLGWTTWLQTDEENPMRETTITVGGD